MLFRSRGSYVGCIAGALSLTEYEADLVEAGFRDVSIVPTNEIADGMHSAIIRAVKPSKAPAAAPLVQIPVRNAAPCC